MKYKRNFESIAWTMMTHPQTGRLFKVTLEIDKRGILDVLGAKAIVAKGGEARECNGDIRVRAKPEAANAK